MIVRMRFVLAIALPLATLVLAPTLARSQDVADLIAQGRFEQAVAERGDTPPSEVERLIFLEAYRAGYQMREFEYFVSGISWARTLPDLDQPTREKLNFWLGFAGHQMAVRVGGAQTLQAAQISLRMFQDARRLLVMSGDYPEANSINLPAILDATDRHIETQQTIIAQNR